MRLTELEGRDCPAPITVPVAGYGWATQDAWVDAGGPDGRHHLLRVLAGGTGDGPRVVALNADPVAVGGSGLDPRHPPAGFRRPGDPDVWASFFAFEEEFRGGVALESVHTPAGDRLLIGAGPGGAPVVRQFDPLSGAEAGPALVLGDPDRDREGVAYLSSTGGVVYATLGAGAGPRLLALDPDTAAVTASILIGPADDRSGDYRPAPASLGVYVGGRPTVAVDDPHTGATTLYDLHTGGVVPWHDFAPVVV